MRKAPSISAYTSDDTEGVACEPECDKNFSLMALSAPHHVRRAASESAGLTSKTPFSLQNAIRLAVQKALSGTGSLGRSNWAFQKGLAESVFLMEYWEDEKQSLEEKLLREQPNVLFIGTMTPSLPGAIDAATLAKKMLGEDVFVVLGGKHVNETFFRSKQGLLHAKGSPLRLMRDKKIGPIFDLVCSGRSEELIAIIAERLGELISDGKNPTEIYTEMESFAQTVPGDWRVGWLEGKKIRQYQGVGIAQSVENMPVPAALFGINAKFDVFGTDYTAHAFSETSAGCSKDCFFCSEKMQINGPLQNVHAAADRILRQFKAILNEARETHGTESVSAFVEDSIFLGTVMNPKPYFRLAEMMRKENCTISFGAQFIVDQLADPKIQEALLQLKQSGLSYVFTGMETGDEEIATTMSKNLHQNESWIKRYEMAIAFLSGAGIKLGMAVLFGLGETQETRMKQLAQIKEWQQKYNEPSVVSLNLATIHPLQKADGTEEDFTEWGVAADSPYLNIFQRIFSEASDRYPVTRKNFPTLEELHQIEEQYHAFKLQQEIRRTSSENPYHASFDEDFYFDDALYQRYLKGTFSAIHLNSASLAAPSPAVCMSSEEMAKMEERLSAEEKADILKDTRKKAAELVGLPDDAVTGVIFGRNTTEAGSFAFWLAGLRPGDHVVLTDAENPSVRRSFELHMDHGNPLRADGWSAWATHYSVRGPTYEAVEPKATSIQLSTISLLDATEEEIENELYRAFNAKTKMFVFSHVMRNTGKEIPVEKICDIAKRVKAEKNPHDPNIFILVDGAQALGNVPKVDFQQLGCDAYMAAPHKTMRSTVVGMLFFDPRNPMIRENLSTMNDRCTQVILKGMFDPETSVLPNVEDSLSCADIAGLSAAIDELHAHGLKENDFSAIAQTRERLRQYCVEQLNVLSAETGIDILIPYLEQPTGFILAIQIPDKSGRNIAEQLSAAGVFVSYIQGSANQSHSNILRISFQYNTTKEEIDAFISKFNKILRGDS